MWKYRIACPAPAWGRLWGLPHATPAWSPTTTLTTTPIPVKDIPASPPSDIRYGCHLPNTCFPTVCPMPLLASLPDHPPETDKTNSPAKLHPLTGLLPPEADRAAYSPSKGQQCSPAHAWNQRYHFLRPEADSIASCTRVMMQPPTSCSCQRPTRRLPACYSCLGLNLGFPYPAPG